MIDVRQAVEIASQYFTGIYQSPITDLTVEEVEQVDMGPDTYWDITLGFNRNVSGSPFLIKNERVYRVIRINADSGQPISMKMRTL